MSVRELFSNRGLIEKYKMMFTFTEKLGKGAREGEVDYKVLAHKRYKEITKEVKRERERERE